MRRIVLAGLLGAVFAAVFIGLMSGGDVDRMTFGDGQLHRLVASDLTVGESDVHPAIDGSGPALRYGRIGFPAVLWAFSGGQKAAMPFVQPLLMVLCAAGIAMTTVALMPQHTLSMGLSPFVAVGLTASLAGGFAEPLAVLLSLLAVLLVERNLRWPAAGALAGAMLTRENAVVVVVGLVAWLLLRRRIRDAAAISISVVPVAAWHLIVGERFGSIPLRDPWLIDTGALGVPFVAVGKAFGDVSASGVAIIAVHLLLVAVALKLWRTSALGMVAAVSALPMVSVGAFSWRYIGDASRLGVFLEVFAILAVIAVLTRPKNRTVSLETVVHSRVGQAVTL